MKHAKGILGSIKNFLFPGNKDVRKAGLAQRFFREVKRITYMDFVLLFIILLVAAVAFFLIILSLFFMVYVINTSGFVTPPFKSAMGPGGPGGCYPMCWPAEGWISSLAPHGKYNTLNAVDIATGGVNGQPVYATHDGVAVCGWDNTGYGNLCTVTSDCIDNFRSLYGHFQRFAIPEGVEVPVKAGDMLGELDDTGNSTGPHLHYEIRDGDPNYNSIYNYIPPYNDNYNIGDHTEGCFAKDSGGGEAPPTP